MVCSWAQGAFCTVGGGRNEWVPFTLRYMYVNIRNAVGKTLAEKLRAALGEVWLPLYPAGRPVGEPRAVVDILHVPG